MRYDPGFEKVLWEYAESVDVTKRPESLIDVPPAESFRRTAHAAVANGFRVIPLIWGSKRPQGELWTTTASDDMERIQQWASAARFNWGMGLIPGRTVHGYRVVLDADTSDAYVFLKNMLGAPTVLTAGRSHGAHKGGAHWYITLDKPIPDLTVAAGKTFGIDIIGGDASQRNQVVGAGSYVCKGKKNAPVPPGYYHDVSYSSPLCTIDTFTYLYEKLNTPLPHDHPLYKWLLGLAAQNRRQPVVRDPNRIIERDALNQWMRDTTWAELLSADGWRHTGTELTCGCDVWEHPWGASEERSAVAHVEGCDKSQSGYVGGALHLFSTTAQRVCNDMVSVSKYDYVAYVRHGGSHTIAREKEGIPDEEGFGRGCGLDIRTINLK